jgi:hypothetical protein
VSPAKWGLDFALFVYVGDCFVGGLLLRRPIVEGSGERGEMKCLQRPALRVIGHERRNCRRPMNCHG